MTALGLKCLCWWPLEIKVQCSRVSHWVVKEWGSRYLTSWHNLMILPFMGSFVIIEWAWCACCMHWCSNICWSQIQPDMCEADFQNLNGTQKTELVAQGDMLTWYTCTNIFELFCTHSPLCFLDIFMAKWTIFYQVSCQISKVLLTLSTLMDSDVANSCS